MSIDTCTRTLYIYVVYYPNTFYRLAWFPCVLAIYCTVLMQPVLYCIWYSLYSKVLRLYMHTYMYVYVCMGIVYRHCTYVHMYMYMYEVIRIHYIKVLSVYTRYVRMYMYTYVATYMYELRTCMWVHVHTCIHIHTFFVCVFFLISFSVLWHCNALWLFIATVQTFYRMCRCTYVSVLTYVCVLQDSYYTCTCTCVCYKYNTAYSIECADS